MLQTHLKPMQATPAKVSKKVWELRPVPASQWVLFNPDVQQGLRELGGVPINDVLMPLWLDNSKIKTVFGGRGGGKTATICRTLLDQCLQDDYFYCLYGRKVAESVRASMFRQLVRTIEQEGLQQYFKYGTAPNSDMTITCVNGNSFDAFGLDNVDKLKGRADPTHIWVDEADQITFEDFKDLYPTLRVEGGKNYMYLSFNSYAVFERHWLLKLFFPDVYAWEEGEAAVEVENAKGERLTVSSYLVNYYHNYFIDKVAYEQGLRLVSGGNKQIYEGMANGAWGMTDNANPWLYSFDYDKHVREPKDMPFLPSYEVYLSFDFNNDPFACTAWQMSPSKGVTGSFLHCIAEFSGIYKIEDMCQRIKSTFPASIFYITGDATSSNKAELGRNQTVYQMIASHLNVPPKLMDLNTKNLEHADSRQLCNIMLSNYPNFYISSACKGLIRQIQGAKVDDKSHKASHLLKDRGQYKNDELDSFRYMLQTYFNDYVRKVLMGFLK